MQRNMWQELKVLLWQCDSSVCFKTLVGLTTIQHSHKNLVHEIIWNCLGMFCAQASKTSTWGLHLQLELCSSMMFGRKHKWVLHNLILILIVFHPNQVNLTVEKQKLTRNKPFPVHSSFWVYSGSQCLDERKKIAKIYLETILHSYLHSLIILLQTKYINSFINHLFSSCFWDIRSYIAPSEMLWYYRQKTKSGQD